MFCLQPPLPNKLIINRQINAHGRDYFGDDVYKTEECGERNKITIPLG